MTRWKAAGLHLLISAIVIGGVAALLLWRWYPPALWGVAKADKLMLILAVVDVSLGPLLTWIVYKPGKKSLRFDLSVIALLQIAALAYGLNTVWQSRPVYLVGVVDRFQLVFANELDAKDLADASEPYRALPITGLQTVGAQLPQSAQLREALFYSAMRGKDVHLFPSFYVPYEDVAPGIARGAMTVPQVTPHLSQDERTRLAEAVRSSGTPGEALAVLPVDTVRESASAAMLIEARTGRIVAPVDVDPWPAYRFREKATYPQRN